MRTIECKGYLSNVISVAAVSISVAIEQKQTQFFSYFLNLYTRANHSQIMESEGVTDGDSRITQ